MSTPGNVDDRTPVLRLAHRLHGTLVADKGYLSHALAHRLQEAYAVRLLTHRKRNMVQQLLSPRDAALLRKRTIIESVFDQLKHMSQIAHTRHRSPANFVINLLAGLVA